MLLDDGKISLQVDSTNNKNRVKLKVILEDNYNLTRGKTSKHQHFTTMFNQKRQEARVYIRRKNRVDWTFFCEVGKDVKTLKKDY